LDGVAVIIDADGHYVEQHETIRSYVDPAFRARAPRYVVADDGTDCHEIDGHRTRPFAYGSLGDPVTPQGMVEGSERGRLWTECERGGWDPNARLAFHDAEGIDAAVLFPTLGLMLGGISDARLADALATAINRWLADYCSAAPGELYGVANLPAQDPRLAATELRRAVVEHGFVAGMMRPNPYPVDGGTRYRAIGDPSLDVLWATAQDLGVPMCIHEGTVLMQPTIGSDRGRTYFLHHAIAHPLEAMVAFASLYEGGVFDRFPALKIGFMEANAGWVPFWTERLDEHCEMLGWSLDRPLERLPSEVFEQQCWIGCESEERSLGAVHESIGSRMMWASDYPHFDAHLAGENTPMILGRDDLDDEVKQQIVCDAALNFYGLDPSTIQAAIAARRGVTAEPRRAMTAATADART
jgi:hypothetical protein